MTTPSLRGQRIVFFANVDWSFLSHRREIAAACVAEGADVTLMAGDTGRIHEIEALGVRAVPLSMSRTGTQLGGEARAVREVADALRRLRPSIQHNVSIKPVLYGTIMSRLRRPEVLINAVSGAGSIFDRAGAVGALRDTLCMGVRPMMNSSSVYWVFQNENDLDLYQRRGLVRRDQWTLTMGSGVDLDRFTPSPFPHRPTALFASRLIWSKGVGTFVEAAAMVRSEEPKARFVLAGDPEDANAGSVGRSQVDEWVDSGAVEWVGIAEDMPALYADSTVFCLPSWYREGVPRVLLEAAACGRPAIAADIPGARRAIEDGSTGVLIEPQNPRALANAILDLFRNCEKAASMGAAAHRRANDTFSVDAVVQETLDLYRRALVRA